MKHFLKFLLLFLPALITAVSGFAQKEGQAFIDSLLRVLPKVTEDTNKVKLLNNLSFAYYAINTDEGVKYGQQALELATMLEWEKGAATANCYIGVNYQYKSDYPKALEYYNKGLEIDEKLANKRGIATITGNMGNVYFDQGDYPKALEYYLKNLKTEEEMGDKQGLATVNMNIGGVYYVQHDFPKTLEYSFQALKILEQIGDRQDAARITANISNVYQVQKDYTKALEYDFKALKIAEEIEDKNETAIVIRNIGTVYASQRNYTMAIEYGQKSLKMFEEAGDKYEAACTLNELGSAYLSLIKDTILAKPYTVTGAEGLPGGKYIPDGLIPSGKAARLRKAIDYLQQSLAISKEIHSPVIIQECNKYLAEAYELSNNYKMALEYSNMYHNTKDSVFSKENDDKILKMTMRHEYDRQRLADSLKTDAALQRQRIINYVGFAGFVLALLLLFFIYRNYSLQKKANTIIRAEKENAEQQRTRAENSERFKQQFLANMSHEIRTPMNAVLGMTNLALDTPLTPKQTKYLTAVKKSSENLLVIINDVLDLSKLEAGKMELEKIPFRLGEQVNQVYDTMQFKAEEKGLVLHTEIGKDIPDVLEGDPYRLNQILINLCGNAIKFTEKGTVKIIAERVPGRAISLRFRVIDSGIGIPADKIDKLFESFRQADAGISRKYGGTGLGLSISKTLVELQGGTMEVSSEEGKGSEFSFTITYEIASEAEAASLNYETNADHTLLRGIKILVAEDNEYNQIVIRDTLENLIEDVKVDVAENGKTAIEKLFANDYDVILMDAHMPEMSGLEATEYIRRETGGNKRDIPIIALTASVLNADLNKCTEAGMNDYIPKPFTRAQLLNTLAKYYKNDMAATAVKEGKNEAFAEMQNEDAGHKITDLTFLRNFCDGDRDRMKKYIDIYLKLTPGNLEKINKAGTEKDYASLSQTVHGMKPRLDFMGMKEAKAVAQKIELYATGQNNLELLPDLIALLQSDYDKSEEELRSFA